MSTHVPVSTYRLQLGPDFTFAEATAILEHLHHLGITDLYLSPVLAAAPGSTHGYDVVDHTRISPVLGGREGLETLAAHAHRLGLGVVVDVVPNHMAIPVPASCNPPLWDVLTHGRDSQFGHWFDIDRSTEEKVVLPFLGRPLADVLAAGELTVARLDEPEHGLDPQHPVLAYYDHRFPLRPGTEHLPLPDLLEQQHYRLAHWRSGQVNYRRFFDVDALIGLRMEDEDVFTGTHGLLLELIEAGTIDALRIDHPDGLADPTGYLHRLHRATGGIWTVVEKILAPHEQLPQHWPVAGTTGYDAAWRIEQVLIEPGGAQALRETMDAFAPAEFTTVCREAKRQVATTTLRAELDRITCLLDRICAGDVLLRDRATPGLRSAVVELLTAADRYRAYAPGPGHTEDSTGHTEDSLVQIVHAWSRQARRQLPSAQHPELELVTALVVGQPAGSPAAQDHPLRTELVIRFQQLCGAVMAKGIEDTAYYRWTQLTSLCEVGGAPERFALEPEDLYRWAAHTQDHWPHTLTALSTHDAKRSEDVRARIGVLSQYPREWAALVHHLRTATAHERPAHLHGATENLLWQTLAGTWTAQGAPPADRFTDYLIKASREAKVWTGWTEPDQIGETALVDYARHLVDSEEVATAMAEWVTRTAGAVRAATLGARALQLMLPGVADTYQGTEVTTTSLVDPDNRRPVDHERIRRLLARLDAGEEPADLPAAKLQLSAALLRLRRRRPEVFVGPAAGFLPLATTSGAVVAFARTHDGEAQVVTLVTRRYRRLIEEGTDPDALVHLPAGQWRSVLTSATYPGGPHALAQLLESAPVEVLERVN